MFGERIMNFLNDIESRGTKVLKDKSKHGDVYSFGDDRYRVEVTVGEKWVGLNFKLKEIGLEYWTDTDLYDIAKPEYLEFGEEIENDILDFLDRLTSGQVEIAQDKNGDWLLLIPTQKGALFVKSYSKAKIDAKKMEELKQMYDFESFSLAS